MQSIVVFCGDDASGIHAANVYAEQLSSKYELYFVEENLFTLDKIRRFCRVRLRKQGITSLFLTGLLYAYQFFEKRPPLPEKKYIPSLHVAEINGNEGVLALLAEVKPAHVLTSFCSLIREPLLSRLPNLSYNVHPGINPRYRGFGNIWACYEENFSTMGYTVHRIDAGTDTGDVVANAFIDFAQLRVPFEELDSYAMRCGANALVSFLMNGACLKEPAFAHLESRLYPIPTLPQYIRARKRYTAYVAAK